MSRIYIYIPDDATPEETDEASEWLWNRKFDERKSLEMPIRPSKSWLEAM